MTITPRPDDGSPDDDRSGDKAAHGYRNEVSWDGGQGRQPYANQEQELPPASAPEAAEGDRGSQSGENLDQLEKAKLAR